MRWQRDESEHDVRIRELAARAGAFNAPYYISHDRECSHRGQRSGLSMGSLRGLRLVFDYAYARPVQGGMYLWLTG
jgi:hypothetical protein